MKKVNKTIISIVSALVLMLSLPITAFALDIDTYYAEIEFTNAPEGTAYMDILVKMDESDENYTEFTCPPRYKKNDYLETEYKYLQIDKDSEIATLNDDGYISLSLHYKDAEFMTVNKVAGYRSTFSLLYDPQTKVDFWELRSVYGDFKAAYVDENGNVLGITGVAEITYERYTAYEFMADGDDLTLRAPGHSASEASLILLKIMGIGLLIIIGFALLIGLPFFSLGRAFLSKQ